MSGQLTIKPVAHTGLQPGMLPYWNRRGARASVKLHRSRQPMILQFQKRFSPESPLKRGQTISWLERISR